MVRRTVTTVIAVPLLLGTVLGATPAQGEDGLTDTDVHPPWCGVPEPDAAENLPDGTDPGDPLGSFPHIPYYSTSARSRRSSPRATGYYDVIWNTGNYPGPAVW